MFHTESEMKSLALTSQNLTRAVMVATAALQKPGAVILIPTETVYGLACRWDDITARERIYRMKMRDERKPLAMFATNLEALRHAGVILTNIPELLATHFCPGPITIIACNCDGSTTGFRIPDYPLVQALLTALKFPLATTSANLSGHPNALSPAQALAELTEEPDLVIDAGMIAKNAQPSTVVDATGLKPIILREGPINHQMIEDVLADA